MRLLGLREIFITESEIVRIGKGKGKRRENQIIRGWAVGCYSDNFFFTLGFSSPQPTNSSVLEPTHLVSQMIPYDSSSST